MSEVLVGAARSVGSLWFFVLAVGTPPPLTASERE